MGETPSTFSPSFNASLVIEARPERLTSDAGAVIVREAMERTGIIAWLTERLHDPRQPHLVTYPLADLLRTMLVLFAQAAWVRAAAAGGGDSTRSAGVSGTGANRTGPLRATEFRRHGPTATPAAPQGAAPRG